MRNWLVALIAVGGCDRTHGAETTGVPTPTDQVDGVDADYDGYVVPGDCDDTDADVHPGADERCNTIDDDCDGAIDEDAVDGDPGFVDEDGDGFGESALPLVSCTQAGWAPVGGDCADGDAARHPGVVESCNGVDDDCDGRVDEGAFLGDVLYETIQEAVVAATDGAVILLCDGTTLEGAILIDHEVEIRSTSGDPSLTVIDGSSADGSVFVVNGGNLTLEGLTVRGGTGTPTDIDPLGLVRAGGGVSAVTEQGGEIVIASCVFEDNSSDAGGALAGTLMEVTDTTFLTNDAVGAIGGGAVWVADTGSLSVERSVFENNSALDGGAIYARGPVVLKDVEAFGNATVADGGFAYVDGANDGVPPASLQFLGGDIHDNKADDGGALYLVDAGGSADGYTVFHDNFVYGHGGALTVSVGEGLVSWDGGSFVANIAYGGAGIYLDPLADGTVAVANVVVTDNEADIVGGGIEVHKSAVDKGDSVVIRDSTVAGNVTLQGGGIYVKTEGDSEGMTVALDNVVITDNLAEEGGGLYLLGGWVTATDVSVTDNVAMQGGGALLTASCVLDVRSSNFLGNAPSDVGFDGSAVTFDLPDLDGSEICTEADATCL